MGDTFSKLFGDDDDEKSAGGAYDKLFGSPEAEAAPAEEEGGLKGILKTLLHGQAQENYGAMVDKVAESGVKYEPPHTSDIYMAAAGPAPAKAAKGLLGGLAAVGKDAAGQTAVGAVQGAMDAARDGEDMQGMLKRILESGGLAGAAELGLSALGGTAGKVGDMFSFLGRKADNTKAGSNSKLREDLIEKFGIENGPDMLGELLRKYSPSSLFSPKTSAGHLGAIESQLADEGSNLAAMTRQAGEEGADAASPAAMQGAHEGMLDKASALDAVARSDSKASEAKMLEAILNRSASKPDPTTFEGLIGAKSQYGDDAFRKVTGFADEDAKSQAAKQAWMTMKDAEQNALGAATEDTAGRFTDSQKAFGELSSLNDSLKPRASADDAVGNAGTAMVGAAAGALMPGGQGLMGALTSGTNNAVRQMTGGVAHDMFSNVMHPAGAAAKGLGSALDRLPTGALTAEGFDQQHDSDAFKGYQTNQLVDDALQQNPRMFGKYAYLAKMSPDERKAEMSRLQDDDPAFNRLLQNLHATAASLRQ